MVSMVSVLLDGVVNHGGNKIVVPMTTKYANPISFMAEFHHRAERFLSLLITVQRQTHGGLLNDSQYGTLECALRFFKNVAPRHYSDEEESLFPRLQESRVGTSIRKLCEDHRSMEADLQLLEVLGQRWLFDGSLSEADSLLFGNILSRVSRIFSRHIRQEELLVFPAARETLNESEIVMIGREMAARR